MKFLISFLFSVSASAAFPPVVITHAHPEEAQAIKELLIRKHNLPADFIALRASSSPCAKLMENVSWQLCVDAGGNLEEVHADRTFINQTLRIFL